MGRAAILFLILAACGDIAWDTTVANSAAVRRAMVESVVVGATTQTAYMTRWGPPLQRIEEGVRSELVYRQRDRSAEFVIVTFDHEVAVGVRSTETEACRASYSRRWPVVGLDRPEVVVPVGWCAAVLRPGVPDAAAAFGTGGAK